jgi:hypothetical protein
MVCAGILTVVAVVAVILLGKVRIHSSRTETVDEYSTVDVMVSRWRSDQV